MPTSRKPRAKGGYPDTSPEDIAALEEFLRREPWGKRSMSIAMLDGFLTAIVIGPEVVMPSEYFPWIWDWKRGKKQAEFADLDEANRIFGYVQGMHNRVAGPLMAEPPAVLPLFIIEPHRDHREWLAGFAMGAEFDLDVWDHAQEQSPELFEPFEVLNRMEPDDPGRVEAFAGALVSIVGLRDYFRAGEWRQAFEEVQKPFVREGPKVGRNDPCPCGSGRKYKKCCGDSPPTDPVLH